MNLCRRRLHDKDVTGATRFGQCRECKRADARRYNRRRTAKRRKVLPDAQARAVLVDAILGLEERIEREPRKWIELELREELAELLRKMRGLC